MPQRRAVIDRRTKETQIRVTFTVDGSGEAAVRTGLPFLDHMLSLFAKHGLFDLAVRAKGDLRIDCHHTNEDLGICLGEALSSALGRKAGIRRFGEAYVPMEEALARVVLDISGRPLVIFEDARPQGARKLASSTAYGWGDVEHFLESFARKAGVTMHVTLLAGRDFHHSMEAIFKALARALDAATQIDPRVKGIPSTKGRL